MTAPQAAESTCLLLSQTPRRTRSRDCAQCLPDYFSCSVSQTSLGVGAGKKKRERQKHFFPFLLLLLLFFESVAAVEALDLSLCLITLIQRDLNSLFDKWQNRMKRDVFSFFFFLFNNRHLLLSLFHSLPKVSATSKAAELCQSHFRVSQHCWALT